MDGSTIVWTEWPQPGHGFGLTIGPSHAKLIALLARTGCSCARKRIRCCCDILAAARIRRALAQALTESGDRETALKELRVAHDTFATIGAKGELENVRNEIRKLGSRPPPKTSADGMGGLTGRELEIARMVASRKSNREIGESLDISARTVSTHLSNIFAKVGVSSRGELADFIRESSLQQEH